ncbi:MAG TPA: hypothetical protein DEO83_05430 [Lachnospiraceae bacterium]|nr:hypothetical protein [Lachnospiraceae bacterium]
MKKRKNSNVIKLSRAARLNSAFIIFGIILVYVVASVIKSVSKEPITTYKVSSSNINNNIICDAIALRKENEVTTSKSGYLIYFVRDGDKIKKNAPVCTVDETGNVINSIKAAGESEKGNELFTRADYINIRTTIDTYKSAYSDEKFYNLYNFKSEIESKVMDLSSQVMMEQIQKGGAAVSSTVQTINAGESGVVSYYIDGFEKKTPETLSVEDFNQANYKKTSLKTGDILDSGSVAYKMTADENWHIVCMITNEQAKSLQEEEKVKFSINNSPNDIRSKFTLIPRGDYTFLVIQLNKYMVDYISERFLKVEIILNKFEGLKVPNTALLEKEVYKIPKDDIDNDKESGKKHVKVLRYDDATNGDASEKDVDLIVYKSDEDYYYVDKDAFNDTDILLAGKKRSQKPVMSLERDKMNGVYLANTGIADFTEVEVVKSQDEFTIINDDGYLKEFDNIVLDSSEVYENQTLY